MEKYVINNKFNIGDTVYHILGDSPKGIVLDVIYFFSTKKVQYRVAWGTSEESDCQEIELSEDKIIF